MFDLKDEESGGLPKHIALTCVWKSRRRKTATMQNKPLLMQILPKSPTDRIWSLTVCKRVSRLQSVPVSEVGFCVIHVHMNIECSCHVLLLIVLLIDAPKAAT